MSFGDDTLDPANLIHITVDLETKIRARLTELRTEYESMKRDFLTTDTELDMQYSGIAQLEWVLREAGLKC